MNVVVPNACATVGADGFLSHLELHVPGEPVAKARARGRATLKYVGGKPKAVPLPPYPDKRTTNYEHTIASAVRHVLSKLPRSARRFRPSDPLRVVVVAVFPRPKSRPDDVPRASWQAGCRLPRTATPDFDNVAKVATDALNGTGVWLDDAHVVEALTRTCTAGANERPHLELHVEPVPWPGQAPLFEGAP